MRRIAPKNLSGMIFSRLKVLELDGLKLIGKQYRQFYKCQCECGNIIICRRTGLLGKYPHNTSSCGCLQKENAYIIHTIHGATQNNEKTPEFSAWQDMKARCLNSNHKCFHRYGGRGITVYSEWIDSFEKFISYIGLRPSNKYSLDRINNDGNYEPGNVRWATKKEQSNNRSDCIYLTYNDNKLTLQEWSSITGISSRGLKKRLDRGMSIYDVLNTPSKKNKNTGLKGVKNSNDSRRN
jgi:hypothetical protein